MIELQNLFMSRPLTSQISVLTGTTCSVRAQILSSDDHLGRFGEMFRYLVMCSTSERVKAIGLSQWRDGITNVIATQTIDYRRLELYLIKIRSQLAHLEQEYFALKTSTTLLELALWKNKLNDEDGCQEETTMTKLNKSSVSCDLWF